MIDVLVNNEYGFAVAEEVLADVVRQICLDHGVKRGEVSLAIVDDRAMHQLNRQHLAHDYPTDVLSFLLDRDGNTLEGEVIVSADTANSVAAELDWPAKCELLLYFIHGTLHLVGYDDFDDQTREQMRDRERYYLRAAGLEPSNGHQSPAISNGPSREASA